MNANLLVIVGIIASVSFGCEPTAKPKTEPTDQEPSEEPSNERAKHPGIKYDEGPIPGPDTVIATAGDFKVTIADYEFASKLGLLYAPEGVFEVPPEKLAMSHVHTTLTQSLITHKVVEHEAAKRKIEVTDAEIRDQLAKRPQLRRFLDDPEALKPYGISFDDLMQMGRTEVTKEKFANALLEETPEDELWQAYQTKMHRVKAIVASTKNLAGTSELNAFTEANADKIKKYFEDNPHKFKIPARSKVNLIKPPKGGKATEEALQNAATRLRNGERIDEIAKSIGWEFESDVELWREENLTAFRSESGTAGFEKKGPRGAYAWLRTGGVPARPKEFSTAVEREIASLLVTQDAIAGNTKQRAERAIEVLKGTTLENLEEKGLDLVRLGFRYRLVTFDASGVIPEFGLAEPVVSDAMSADNPRVSQPILSRQEVFLYKSFDHQRPDRKVFEKDYDAFRTAVLKAKKPRVLQQFMARYTNEHPSKLNTKPLRVLYGVLQKTNALPPPSVPSPK